MKRAAGLGRKSRMQAGMEVDQSYTGDELNQAGNLTTTSFVKNERLTVSFGHIVYHPVMSLSR